MKRLDKINAEALCQGVSQVKRRGKRRGRRRRRRRANGKKAKKLPPFLLPDTTGGARRSLRDYVVAAVVAARVGWTATEDEPWEEMQDEEEEIDLASVHSLEYYYDNDIDLYADGDDIRSLFELRESGKACVGAVASVAWQAGWCGPWARPVRCIASASTITRGGRGLGTALSCWRLIRQHLVPLSASCPPFPVCPLSSAVPQH